MDSGLFSRYLCRRINDSIAKDLHAIYGRRDDICLLMRELRGWGEETFRSPTLTRNSNFDLDRMQKGLAIIGLFCCAAGVCHANAAPSAWVNAVYTSAMGGGWGLSPMVCYE